MNLFAHTVMIGWIPVVLLLFALLPPRRAVIAAFIIAWLFLPMAGYRFEGIPNYTKVSATSFGALLGILLFDSGRLLSFRPKWFDLPMLLWCISPYFSSVSNGLGHYDGISSAFSHVVFWGLPYFIGRLYFIDPEGIRELAIGIFLGGLIYVPFCLWEVRMSPQLHYTVYGYHAHDFAQTRRDDSWRPTVFMQHGLMVSLWMVAATLTGLWLWRTQVLRMVMGIPSGVLVAVMLFTTILTRSALAILLLLVGLGVLYSIRWLRTTALVVALIAIPIVYMLARASFDWSGEVLVHMSADIFGEDRARSLSVRLNSENLLVEHGLHQPLFGWGGWHRGSVQGAIPDGLWVIALTRQGLFGLVCVVVVVLLPLVMMWWHHPARHWLHPAAAPAVVLSVLLGIYMIDNLFNAMLNPIYMLAAGGVAGLVGVAAERRRRPATRPAGFPVVFQPSVRPLTVAPQEEPT